MDRRSIGATVAGFSVAAIILSLLAFFVGAADVLEAIAERQARSRAAVRDADSTNSADSRPES